MGDSRVKSIQNIIIILALIPQLLLASDLFTDTLNRIPYGEENSSRYIVDLSLVHKTGHGYIRITASAKFAVYKKDDGIICKIRNVKILSKLDEVVQENINAENITITSDYNDAGDIKFSSTHQHERIQIINETFDTIIRDHFFINVPHNFEIKKDEVWVNERKPSKFDSGIPIFNKIEVTFIEELQSLHAITFSGLSSTKKTLHNTNYASKHVLYDKTKEKVLSVQEVFYFNSGKDFNKVFMIKLQCID